MSATCVALVIVNASGWLLPDPVDKHGWALRARLLDSPQPFLVGEYLDRRKDVPHPRLLIALGNRTKFERKYLLLDAAWVTGYLRLFIHQSDGTPLPWTYRPGLNLGFDGRRTLEAGKWDSREFDYGELDCRDYLPNAGVYELRVELRTEDGSIVSPTIKFKVIEPAADAILASYPVPLEGYEAKWPKEKQQRPVVQQIQIEGRTWLVYRRYGSPNSGGKANFTQRLAELPGKVDVKVNGAYGNWGPLTVTYKNPGSTTGSTKLVVNSVGGLPWTESDEKYWLDELQRIEKAKKALSDPRPKKP